MKINIQHHHHHSYGKQVPPWAVALDKKVSLILKTLSVNMKELDDLVTAVAAEDTVIDGAVTMIQGIPALVAAGIAAAGVNVTPQQLAAITGDITTRTTALAAALVANTPTPVVAAPPIAPVAAAELAAAAVAA